MKKISIIIPVYNTEQFLHRCIDSVLAQKFADFELILVDDGSTDTSGNICDEYAANDSRIIVIHQKNAGQAAARNYALSIVGTEYVTFIDSDDYVDDNYLIHLFGGMEEKTADLCMSGFILENENGKILLTHQRKKCLIDLHDDKTKINFIISHIINNLNNRSCWSNLFRLSIIKKYSIFFCTSCHNFAEDTGFLITYLLYCGKIATIEYYDYHYIRHFQSTLSSMAGDNMSKINSLNEVSVFFAEHYFHLFYGRYYQKKFSELYFHLMKWDYKQYDLFGVSPEQTAASIEQIGNIQWHDKWLKQNRYHLRDLTQQYGKKRAIKKWINIKFAVKRSPRKYRLTLTLIDMCGGLYRKLRRK